MKIVELKVELKNRIENLDKRIEIYEKPSNYDWSKKIEKLHSEAYTYEKVLKMLDT